MFLTMHEFGPTSQYFFDDDKTDFKCVDVAFLPL